MRVPGWALMAMAVFAMAGCTREEAPPPLPAGANALAQAAPEDDEARSGRVFPSRRCGECHGRQLEEWRASAHSRAQSEAYEAASQGLDAAARTGCSGCHAPLASYGKRVAKDGVGCDACHVATGFDEGRHTLVLSPELATRFGPYKDSQDHHFHKAAQSDFVTGPGLCAACHEDRPDAQVPTYTTVSEWRAQPEAVSCNDCHMPSLRAHAAKGEKLRSVSRHDFHPDKAQALRGALTLRREASAPGELALSLVNDGAAHHLPTGRPERRLLWTVAFEDGEGRKVGAASSRSFGRVLVDATGAPSVSFRAVREERDERLARGEARTWQLQVPDGARTAKVQVLYQRFDEALASAFGAAQTGPLLILERREALSPP